VLTRETALGDADIEQLVERQARGDTITSADVAVEQMPPSLVELDTRRSKSSLSLGLVFGETGAAPDSHLSGGDASPPDTAAASEHAPEETQPVPPELGSTDVERQDMALAQDPPVPNDEGLGLIFQRNSA
jgi:hypothetical protein